MYEMAKFKKISSLFEMVFTSSTNKELINIKKILRTNRIENTQIKKSIFSNFILVFFSFF